MGNKNQAASRLREGHVLIITGASSGLGKQLALKYCTKGLRIILTGRDQKRLALTKQSCEKTGNSQILTFIGDLSQKYKCKELIDLCIKNYNRIDAIVLNAGINAHFNFDELDNKQIQIFDRLMKTNFYANVFLTKFSLPYLKRTNGAIVVVSSLSGKFGLPSRSAYCASKFALTGFFQSLRTEQNIPIFMVYPTSLQTPMRSKNITAKTSSKETASNSIKDSEKRQDPKECAQFIVNSINNGIKDIYIPIKGYLGVVLQPMFPNFIRQKLKKAAKL